MKMRLLAVCAAVLPLLGWTADVQLAAGENTLTDEMNVKATRLVSQNDASLKLSGTATDGVFTLNCGISAVKGSFAIDATDIADITELRVKGNLSSTAIGSITIKGVNKITFGADTQSAIDKGVAYTHFNYLDTSLVFKKGDGGDYESSSLVLTNNVCLRKAPACSYAVADGAVIAPYAANALALADGATLTLDKWTLFLISDVGVNPTAKIKFAANAAQKVLYFKPCTVNSATAGTPFSWAGAVETLANDIELTEGTSLFGCNRNLTTFSGQITGTGDIVQAHDGAIKLSNAANSFVGDILLEWSDASANYHTAAFCSSSPGNAANGIKVTSAQTKSVTTIYPQPAGFGETATTFAMGELAAGTALDPYTVLQTYALQTVSVQKVTGYLKVAGGGETAIAEVASGAKVYLESGATLRQPTTLAADATLSLVADASGNRDWGLAGPSGGTAWELTLPLAEAGSYQLRLSGTLDLGELPAGCTKITVAAGADVTAQVEDASAITVRNLGGTLRLLGPNPSWQSKLALWVDAEDDGDMTYAKDWEYIKGDRETAFASVPTALGLWKDCRGATDWCFAQLRFTQASEVSSDAFRGLYPRYVSSGGPNDKAYVTMPANNKCRFYLTRPSALSQQYATVKQVVMVFGSANGGGSATVTEKDAKFQRTAGVNKPVVTGTTLGYAISVDGVAKTRSEATLNGSWQILSLAITNESSEVQSFELGGIGSVQDASAGSGNGGQDYAEILVFSEALTADELAAVEKYLSEKWGVAVAEKPVPSVVTPVTLSGGFGTIDVTGDIALSGCYSGTLNLNGQRVTMSAGTRPYRAEEIPSDGRLLWADPSLAGAVVTGGADDAEVALVYSRDNAGNLLTADGARCLVGPKSETKDWRPTFVNSARAVGGAAGWIDYSPNASGDTQNNSLTMGELPATAARTNLTSETALPQVAEFFLTLDSSRGGGTTFLSVHGGQKGGWDFGARAANGADYTKPIWSENCSDKVRGADSKTYLDGVPVDGASDGFTGRPEVLAFYPSAVSGSFKAIGYSGVANHEIFAESIFYSTVHTDAERRRIEAYLMRKWLDRLPDGFVDFASATVTGAGTLAADSPDCLPILGDGFTGDIELAGLGRTFELNGGTAAVNAVDLTGHSVAFTSTVTIDLTATRRTPGTYTLATGIFDPAQTTLSKGTIRGIDPNRVTLNVTATKITATIESRGFLLYLR